MRISPVAILLAVMLAPPLIAQTASQQTVLHAARLLVIETGEIVSPGEILVTGDQVTQSGKTVRHPSGAQLIDLGDTTLMPGLIDAHVHLFLHPGDEELQTVKESVAERTVLATLAAKADLLAGFTAERDMGTEGAGPADTAVRDLINDGTIPGPRMRISGNAISVTGGHEDALHFNPDQHVLGNATYADSASQLVSVIREQLKQGADFIKIYETGHDTLRNGKFFTPYQYSEPELTAAVAETARMNTRVGVHCTGEPGALYAAEAGVASIDHAYDLGDQTMKLMREKHIFAVPTFAISEYFAQHASSPEAASQEEWLQKFHVEQFKKQLAAGVPMAVGSDVGPFPHGTQARELELMVQYGMSPLATLQADLLNGAELLDWKGHIGTLKPDAYADIIAVPGNPLTDISAITHVSFVMKNGTVYRK